MNVSWPPRRADPTIVSPFVEHGAVPTPTSPWSEFWKFRKVDSRLEPILCEKRLWFSTPNDFNDPFDCQVDIDETFAAIRKQLREHLDGDFSAMVARVEQHTRATSYAYFCVCRIWHQTLMWSHYAGNHRGVALGFTFGAESPFRWADLTKGDVVYKASALRDQMVLVNEAFGMSRQFRPGTPGLMWSEGLEIVDRFHDSLMRLYKIVRFMKAECWSYEKEFRFEATLNDPTSRGMRREFRSNDLRHVLFGVSCPESDVARVRELLAGPEWGHLQYWRCERDAVNLVLRAVRIA